MVGRQSPRQPMVTSACDALEQRPADGAKAESVKAAYLEKDLLLC